MNLFSSPQVRRDFIIGITDILAKIYKVTDPSLKRDIFHELNKLSDRELIAKKDLVQNYLEQSTQTINSYTNKLSRIENEYMEREEQKRTQLPSVQNLF